MSVDDVRVQSVLDIGDCRSNIFISMLIASESERSENSESCLNMVMQICGEPLAYHEVNKTESILIS